MKDIETGVELPVAVPWWKRLFPRSKHPMRRLMMFLLMGVGVLATVAGIAYLAMHSPKPDAPTRTPRLLATTPNEPCGFDDPGLYPRKADVTIDTITPHIGERIHAKVFGYQVVLQFEDHQDRGSYQVWFGRLNGHARSYFTLIRQGREYAGNFGYDDLVFVMRSCGGGHTLAQVNPGQLPVEESLMATMPEPEMQPLPDSPAAMEMSPATNKAHWQHRLGSNMYQALPAPPVQIDVLAAYTPAARDGAAKEVRVSPSHTEAAHKTMRFEILQAVESANRAFTYSGLDIHLNLRWMLPLDSDEGLETDAGFEAPLLKFATLPEVVALREELGIDIAILFVDEGIQAGASYRYNYTDQSSHKAFAMVQRDCATYNLTLAHEVGHILGLDHQCEISDQAGAGHGWYFRENGRRYETVMSKKDKHRRLPFFSDRHGSPKASDAKCWSDEVAVLRLNAPVIANYRQPRHDNSGLSGGLRGAHAQPESSGTRPQPQ